jgi:CspA family cold shock protein
MSAVSITDDEVACLSHEDIEAMVRFYDPQRGFGFVQPIDGSPDARLSAEVLADAGYADVLAGDMIFCSIVAGRAYPQVHEIHFLDRNPFGKPAGLPAPVQGGQQKASGEARHADKPPRRWRQAR